MKRKLLILAICVTLTLTVIIASLLMVNAANKVSNELILIYKDGYVTLMRGDETITVYDNIVVDVLPPADRKALTEGIIIESEEQLYSIIEDYDGANT